MGNEQSTSTKLSPQQLLDMAIAQEATVRTCKDDYGNHEWVKHEDTLMDYCKHCMTRKDVWEVQFPDNNGNKKGNGEYEVGYGKPPKDTQIKPGEVRNPNGRPLGSKNLTTIVMEALKNKVYHIKNDATGQTTEMSGEIAFAEKILEIAIKKGDREALRMIWEMADGKPTQQHKLDIHSPRGYQVDPEREKVITQQFGMYDDQIPTLEPPILAPTDDKQVEIVQTPITPSNTPTTAQNEPNRGVLETQPYAEHINTGVREDTQSQTGGVREA